MNFAAHHDAETIRHPDAASGATTSALQPSVNGLGARTFGKQGQ
jgi:hypothetical protein